MCKKWQKDDHFLFLFKEKQTNEGTVLAIELSKVFSTVFLPLRMLTVQKTEYKECKHV
jgi:hypothetical protein